MSVVILTGLKTNAKVVNVNLSNIRLPKDLIQRNGVKMLVYGGAGTGKTRSAVTAPRPLVLAVEQGLLSLKDENVPVFDVNYNLTPTMKWEERTNKKLANIVEFFDWLERSNEAKQFDTVYIDSLSEISSLVLESELGRFKDPRQAYGEMADKVLKWVRQLHTMTNKHIVLICKQEMVASNNINYYQPAFEGQKLFREVTHLFDEIFRFQAKRFKTQQGFQEFMVCSTKNMQDYLARDKSGKLAEDEPQDISVIINKIMA